MITVKRKLNLRREEHGRVRVADEPSATETVEAGRVPRVSRLMALAIRFEQLLADGVVADQSELAGLAGVTQPRVTQILNLLYLAPDIQEALLFLPRVTVGKDSVTERDLRVIVAVVSWKEQRGMWRHALEERRALTFADNRPARQPSWVTQR